MRSWTNNEHWFTMKLMIYHAAEAARWNTISTISIRTTDSWLPCRICLIRTLTMCRSSAREVKNQMRQRMAADENQAYWIHGEEEYDWGLDRIDRIRTFILTRTGISCWYLKKYEVAPGYMGTPEFTIPKEILTKRWFCPERFVI